MADALRPRCLRRGQADHFPFNPDFAFVWLEQAVENLDQSRFSGAVLAEQRVDLSLADIEINRIVGAERAEPLRDTGKGDQRFGHRLGNQHRGAGGSARFQRAMRIRDLCQRERAPRRNFQRAIRHRAE